MEQKTLAIILVVFLAFCTLISIPFLDSIFSSDNGPDSASVDSENNQTDIPSETTRPADTLSETTAPESTTERPTSTPRPTETSSTPNTITRTPDPTPTKTETTTETRTSQPVTTTSTATPPPTTDLNRTLLENNIESEINEYRRNSGLEELSMDGTTSEDIRTMARSHSRTLRSEGRAWNIPVEYNIEEVYSRHDLYYRCQFYDNDDEVLLKADGAFIAVQSIDIASGDEEQIASRAMDSWGSNSHHQDKFEYQNADIAGVGLVIDPKSETAYVAMSVC